MSSFELSDLIGILRDGQRMGAVGDCLQLLRSIRWVSREEKANTWHALPLHLRQWLQGHNQPIAS